MKTARLVSLVICFACGGCATKPVRPNSYPAQNYPYATLSDLRAGCALKFEGKGIMLDGGSHGFDFSTPTKKKITLIDLCQLAKEQLGQDIHRNSFLLKLGDTRQHELPVAPGSELEAALISGIIQSSPLASSIVAGLKDRSHYIEFHVNNSPDKN